MLLPIAIVTLLYNYNSLNPLPSLTLQHHHLLQQQIMDQTKPEMIISFEFDYSPYFRAYENGHIERFFGKDIVPPSINSPTGVSTKDVLIQPETGVSARVFIPSTATVPQKLPLLVYFHGGAFLVGSPHCSTYHNYISSLVVEANIVAVSVDYRLAPEHHVPIAYEDSWAALQWVASHCNGGGAEVWLNDLVDFGRVFIAGDSAGGNIVHNMAARAGVEELAGGMKIFGACLVQPHFLSKESAGNTGDDKKGGGGDRTWFYACPTSTGVDDPNVNPEVDSRLSRLGCTKVLVCLAAKDGLRERGWFYYETLKKSGWGGEVEVFETEGEEHVFHLFNPDCEKALAFLKRVAAFINQN